MSTKKAPKKPIDLFTEVIVTFFKKNREPIKIFILFYSINVKTV